MRARVHRRRTLLCTRRDFATSIARAVEPWALRPDACAAEERRCTSRPRLARRWTTRASRWSCWALSSCFSTGATRTTSSPWVRVSPGLSRILAAFAWLRLNPTCAAARELEPPGEFSSTRSYAFEFNNVEMPYESYNGVNVRLKCVPKGRWLLCTARADPVAFAGTWCA